VFPLSRTRNFPAFVAFGALFIILAFGTALRYQAFARSVVPDYPHGDAAKYFLYAYNLTNFGVYSHGKMAVLPAHTDKETAREIIKPDALNTPGYPLYLSLFLGGDYVKSQSDRARLGQVILSSLTILLAYAAFSPFGRLYGLGIATLTALSPHLINMNLFLLTETLFCFLLMACVWVISRMNANSRLGWFLLMGLLLTMTTMTRPWIQAYLFVFVGYLIFSKLRFSARQIIFVFIGAAIVTTPWLVRNSMVLGIAADPSQLTNSIHHGMNPNMMYEEQSETLGYAYKADPMAPQLGNSLRVTVTEIARRAKAEPNKYVKWYLVGKIQSVLSWKIIAGADAIFVYHVEESPYFDVPKFYLSAYYYGDNSWGSYGAGADRHPDCLVTEKAAAPDRRAHFLSSSCLATDSLLSGHAHGRCTVSPILNPNAAVTLRNGVVSDFPCCSHWRYSAKIEESGSQRTDGCKLTNKEASASIGTLDVVSEMRSAEPPAPLNAQSTRQRLRRICAPCDHDVRNETQSLFPSPASTSVDPWAPG